MMTLCQKWLLAKSCIRALPVPEIGALSLTKLHTSGGRRNMWTIKARWYLLKHFVLHGSFLLKIYTYIPKLMYFQILLKDFVRNVHLEDVWANTDGPLLFTCFGGRRKCGVWWAIMPWFQEPARWEYHPNHQRVISLQQLLCHGDITLNVNISEIFDVLLHVVMSVIAVASHLK